MKYYIVLFVSAVAVLSISCSSKSNDTYADKDITAPDDNGCGLDDKDSTAPDIIYEIDDENTETPDTADETIDADLELPENDPDIVDNDTSDSEIPEKDVDLFDDSDSDTEAALCPSDMVDNGTSCIDRYEASRPDATADLQGTGTSIAVSKSGVMPWMVNPMTESHYQEFKAACSAAGKRLCKDDEWVSACEGPEKTLYSWGDTYDREICNNVDNFCDDHCADNGIAPEDCVLTENCGYTYNCYKSVSTGSYKNCKNYSGAFDVNGNVWEITDAGSVYMTRGGAFNCAGPSDRLKCQFNATWTGLYAGFRCCKDR